MKSFRFYLGGHIAHLYTVKGEDKYVHFYEQGDLRRLSGLDIKLDIGPNDTHQKILDLIKTKLSAYFDFSRYNEISLPEEPFSESYISNYYLYKSFGGYFTEEMEISVRNDGTVQAIMVEKYSEINSAKVNDENAQAQLWYKLKNIYDTETTRYYSHIPLRTVITQYENKLYVGYQVLPVLETTVEGEPYIYNYYIEVYLIPLEDVSG